MKRHAAIAVLAVTTATACGAPAEDEMTDSTPSPIVELLANDRVVFGIFPGEQSAEGGTAMAALEGMDFVFYSLEDGPFDLDTFQAYVEAMHTALGADAPRRPMALRIPPIDDDPDGARDRARRAIEAGADAIVIPHVQTAEQAAIAAELVGPSAWPARADAAHLSILIVEDQVGIGNVSEILATPGIGVVFAGPGDLRRAYEGDMDAVEAAIQTVLAACQANDVPCGITANADDIGERIAQGFRVFIVQRPDAIVAGRAAVGR